MGRIRLFAALLLYFSGALPAPAQPGPVTGFAFMRVEPSARAAALGGSLSAICCEDLGAFFDNAALLDTPVDGMLAVSYLNHLHDLSGGFAAYGRSIGSLGTAAVGLRFMHYGQLQRTDDTGVQHGTFTASDMVLTLGVGRAYRHGVRYGVNVHLVHSSFDSYRAMALLLDAGVVYQWVPARFTASASLRNAGLVLSSLGDEEDAVPLDFRLSIAKRLRYLPLLVTLTAYNLNNFDGSDGTTASRIASHAILGLEFSVVAAFSVRLGYNHRRHRSLAMGGRVDLAGTGMGFGLRMRGFSLDYAYSSWSFAGLHQLSVSRRL